ncbi:GIY-YIG nuclease family protein [bacterium]|nr:GIY-YIG nuclease family protein [bacterium]
MKREITQFDTKTKYFLDEKGYLYGRDGKMKSTTILLSNGKVKSFTRDKWVAIVYLGAPTDKKFFTKRVNGEIKWTLRPDKTWTVKNWYVPEYDDFRTTFIYYLCDTKDGIPRYVGKTIDPKKRISSHLKDVKYRLNHKSNWIKSVTENGGQVEMVIIDEVIGDGTPGSGDWTWVEQYWGHQFLQWGFNVIIDGGWGNGGMRRKLTEEEKLKHSQIQIEISGKKTYLYDIYKKEKLTFGGSKEACRYLSSLGLINSNSEYSLSEDRVIGGEFLVSYNNYEIDDLYDILKEKTNWDMKVLQLSMDFSTIIHEYNTGREAVRKNKCRNILSVLDRAKTKRKSSMGYRWVYKLDYIYKGVDYLKETLNYKGGNYIISEELINDCLIGLPYSVIQSKHKGVSTGTIGNIKKNPMFYTKQIGTMGFETKRKESLVK